MYVHYSNNGEYLFKKIICTERLQQQNNLSS